MKKIKVAIIYGGRSGEHEVSCFSAAAILKNLDRNLFEPVPIAIDKQGRWLLDQEANILFPHEKAVRINTETAQELPILAQTNNNALSAIIKNEKLFDVAFPVLHGALGEDGTIQGLFEILNVPYVGTNIISSAIGMDKDISKRLVSDAGIEVAPSIIVRGGEWQLHPQQVLKKIQQSFAYPLFVKPCNTGSSVGIEKAYDAAQLKQAIDNAFLYDQKIIVETALNVRDVELSVLENPHYGEPPLVSIAGEVVLAAKHDFYSYTAKYLDPEALTLDIPAKLTPAQQEELQTIARKIFVVLDCESMARVDLFVEKETGKIYFNEINTIPGFTPYSMYPKLWAASGISYQELLTRLVQLAVTKFERKEKFKRDWK